MTLTVWIGWWEKGEPESNILNISAMGVSYGYYDPLDHKHHWLYAKERCSTSPKRRNPLGIG